MRETERRKEKKQRTKHAHTHTHTNTERERETKKRKIIAQIRLGATILTGKSKWFTKKIVQRLEIKKNKEKTKLMERRIATKKKTIAIFHPPNTHTGI